MVVVFDLGGTNARIALVDKGVVGQVVHIPTDRSKLGFAKFLGALQEVATGHRIKALAGGFPGQLAGDDGEVVVATNLPDWLGLKVLSAIKELFDCPVYIANDVELCGLGEAHFGGGMSQGVMVYYTVSTGVNAARIVDGVVDQSVDRYELGYQIVDHDGKKPVSLEAIIGGAAVAKRFGKEPHLIRDDSVWRGLERYLVAGLYNAMLYWDPAVIVLGGRMMRDFNLERVADELTAMPRVRESWPMLVAAKCGDEGGIRGSAVWLKQLGYE